MRSVVASKEGGFGSRPSAGAHSVEAAAPRFSRQAKIGIAAVAGVVGIRVIIGNFVVNEWEGWGVFLGAAFAAVVEGVILGGLVFGLLVRLAARSRGARPAVAALITALLGVLSLAIPYSAPQAILGAGAVALGIAAFEDMADGRASRRIAFAAVAIGALVIAVWLSFIAFTVVTGDWPL
jgi:hypothetical protein